MTERAVDGNQMRAALGAQINALAAERDSTQDEAAKAAAVEAIAKLQNARRLINIAANDAIGAQVDSLLADLKEVQTRHQLDAGSALGVAIDRLREAAGGGQDGNG